MAAVLYTSKIRCPLKNLLGLSWVKRGLSSLLANLLYILSSSALLHFKSPTPVECLTIPMHTYKRQIEPFICDAFSGWGRWSSMAPHCRERKKEVIVLMQPQREEGRPAAGDQIWGQQGLDVGDPERHSQSSDHSRRSGKRCTWPEARRYDGIFGLLFVCWIKVNRKVWGPVLHMQLSLFYHNNKQCRRLLNRQYQCNEIWTVKLFNSVKYLKVLGIWILSCLFIICLFIKKHFKIRSYPLSKSENSESQQLYKLVFN